MNPVLVVAQNSQFPSPLDFGGVGDGIADDTIAIQTAIDASGTVYLGDRTFRITESLTLPSGSNLIGPGTLLVDFETGAEEPTNHALRLNGNDISVAHLKIQKSFLDGSLAVGISGVDRINLTIRGVDIEGYSARPGILLQGCTRFEIHQCTVHDFLVDTPADLSVKTAAGVCIEGSTDGLLASNRIERIQIGPNQGAQGYPAVDLKIQASSRISVVGNHLTTSGVGIHLASSENCVVSGNVLRDHWFDGILLTASRFCAVTDNHISDGHTGIAVHASVVVEPTDDCTPAQPGSPFPINGIVGSVSGGVEDPSTEGDTLMRLTDGNLNNRSAIQQDGDAEFSFLIDLLGEQVITDLTFVSEQFYRNAGQFMGGTVSLEIADSQGGPYTEVATENFSCTRPPLNQMVDEHPTAPATLSEARRVALLSPATARYVRVNSTYCLDNVVLMSEAFANHGPIVHRMRPLSTTLQSYPRVPFYMTDGSTSTYYNPNITSGTVDLDLGPFPAEINEIRIIGKTGDLSGLPQTGNVWVSSNDSPENFDTFVRGYNIVQVGGQVVIPIPSGHIKRYLRLSWDGLQGQTDTRTYIAELEVGTSDPCLPGAIDPSFKSISNVVNGNTILDTGSSGSFGIPGGERVMDASSTGIDLGVEPLFSIVTDNLILDTQTDKTLEIGIQTPPDAMGNIIAENLVTLELEQELTPTPTHTRTPTPTLTPTATPTPTGEVTGISGWRLY